MNSRSSFERTSELPEVPSYLEFKDSENPNKENIDPYNKMLTPLKQKPTHLSNSNYSSNKNSNRSPLQDITPLTTGKKTIKKSPNQVNFFEFMDFYIMWNFFRLVKSRVLVVRNIN